MPEVVVGSGAAPSPSSSSPVSTLSSPSLGDSVSSSQYQDSDLGSITSDAPPSFQPEATCQTSLPDFVPLTDPNFQWGSMEGASFCSVIESCCNEIMHWRKNIFKVPYGNVGDAFVKELTRLFHSYAVSSCLESIALYAAMVMPTLLLQKPPGKVAAKELTKHLNRRLSLWADGDVESLLNEGRAIQARLKPRHDNKSSENLARCFSNLMFLGDVKSALRLLSDRENGNVLSLDTTIEGHTVRDILRNKHPPGQPVESSALFPFTSFLDAHPLLFDQITPEVIRSTALKTSGSSGPSGLDAACWKRLCTSFKSSDDLCRSLSLLAQRLCTSYVTPGGLYPFLASRLIAIDKLPGV